MSNTIRTQRMVDSAPDYYQYSAIYAAIQAAQADEYDSVAAADADLLNQLDIITATWGLKYWEEAFGIPVIEADSYEIRRSRVLSLRRGIGNFSAALVKTVAEAYVNGEVDVAINIPGRMVTITFVSIMGIPPNLADLQRTVENLIHAHLGLTWVFRYLLWNSLNAAAYTWEAFDAVGYTWDTLAVAPL